MKEFVVYTLARFAVFAVTWGVIVGLYVLVRGWPAPLLWPLILAAVLSGVISAYALRGPRDRFSARIQQRADRMSARFEEIRSREDED